MNLHAYYNVIREMSTVRKKATATNDKHDFDQGLKCLAHLIAEAYLRKEKERLAREKTIQEGNNGTE
jgi:hypothetical protein